jgi:hypothetical protein
LTILRSCKNPQLTVNNSQDFVSFFGGFVY